MIVINTHAANLLFFLQSVKWFTNFVWIDVSVCAKVELAQVLLFLSYIDESIGVIRVLLTNYSFKVKLLGNVVAQV